MLLRGEAKNREGLELLQKSVGLRANVDESGAVDLLEAEAVKGLADSLGDEVSLASNKEGDTH